MSRTGLVEAGLAMAVPYPSIVEGDEREQHGHRRHLRAASRCSGWSSEHEKGDAMKDADGLPLPDYDQLTIGHLQHRAPSWGEPRRAPDVGYTPGGSPVQESTAAVADTPLRHGVANQTPKRGRS